MIVTLTETYDLSTVKDKMGIIAIRTPSMSSIDKKWPGFIRNFKFVRPLSCNVRVACASALPADPLQIGTSAGKVAPQDMFNPILYKTVSNESWNGLVNRIYGVSGFTDSLSEVVHVSQDAFSTSPVTPTQSTNAYYALLSEPGWAKAAPQAGLSMNNVKPLVWTVLNTIGAPSSAQFTSPDNTVPAVSANSSVSSAQRAFFLKGHPQPMPRVATVVSAGDVVNATSSLYEGISTNLGTIPSCYCAVLVMPPSTLHLLYYRLVVSWTVEFSVPRSDAELGLVLTANMIGTWTHYQSTSASSASKLSEVSDTAVEADSDHSVEADGVSLDLVMDV